VGETTFAREFLPNYANCRDFIFFGLSSVDLALWRIKGRGSERVMTCQRLTSAVGLIAQSRIAWPCIVLWRIHGFPLTTN
jgi:hypothetical protein